MPYIAQIWNYKDDEDGIKELCDFLFKTKKIIIIHNHNEDDAVFIVSHDVERDMAQAEKIVKTLNSPNEE